MKTFAKFNEVQEWIEKIVLTNDEKIKEDCEFEPQKEHSIFVEETQDSYTVVVEDYEEGFQELKIYNKKDFIPQRVRFTIFSEKGLILYYGNESSFLRSSNEKTPKSNMDDADHTEMMKKWEAARKDVFVISYTDGFFKTINRYYLRDKEGFHFLREETKSCF